MKKLMITFMVALFATVVLGQTKAEIKPVKPAVVSGQTKTKINPGNLPNCILEYVAKNMKVYWIYEAFKIVDKGVITYQVALQRLHGQSNIWAILIFDNNCKLIMFNNKKVP